jgi:hypothetical protein
MKRKNISTNNLMKRLTQKIDALLSSKYSTTQESFTCIRNEVELVKRAPWLVQVVNK